MQGEPIEEVREFSVHLRVLDEKNDVQIYSF